jgi:hypothetical protein
MRSDGMSRPDERGTNGRWWLQAERTGMESCDGLSSAVQAHRPPDPT